MSESKNEAYELSLEQLDAISGGEFELDDPRIVTVKALTNISAANGPCEVGEVLGGEVRNLVISIPAGTQFKVFTGMEYYGYVFSNFELNPQLGSVKNYFYVKLSDIVIM